MSRSHAPHSPESSQHPKAQDASASRFLTLAQASADVFWWLSPEGEMRHASSSWQTFTGQKTSHWLGRGWLDAFHPADQPQIKAFLRQAVTSGQAANRDCHLRWYTGAYRLVRLRAIPVREASGAIREIIVCGDDITAHDLAEQMSQAQRQLAVDASRVGMWDWDLVTDRLVWSDREKALFGLSPETPISFERFLEVVHPDDREQAGRHNTRALAEKGEYTKRFRIIWPDGSVHWLEDRARGMYDSLGQLVHLVGVTVDVTELKQAEERITTILESITDAFIHLDIQWTCTYLNQQAEEYMGKSREEVLGKPLWDVFPDLRGTPFEHQLREAMTTQQPADFDTVHPWLQRWFKVHVYPAQGGLSLYMYDITERKRAEEALQESREELHLLTEMMPQLVWIAQPDGSASYFNHQYYAYLNATPEQLSGNRWIETVHPDDRQKALTHWNTALQTGQPYEIEYRLREGKTGNYHWFLVRARPLTDAQGRIRKWFGTSTNIDQEKQKEEALRQSRDAFRLLTEAMPQLVWLAERSSFLDYANQRWYDYTGTTPQQMQGEEWVSCCHSDDRPKVQTLWHTSLLTSQPLEVEARLREGKTGAYRWFLLRAVPLMQSDGRVWKWLGTCTDLHAQKRTEEALRESELRFRRLVDANIIGIVVFDLEGNIREANAAFLQLVGYTQQDLKASRVKWTAMTPPEYQARDVEALEETLRTGVTQPFEKEYLRKDGTRVPVLMGGTVLRWEDSSPLILAFVLDQTARKELEQQKDLMLAMTTHELKTPLTALKGTLQLLGRRAKRVGSAEEQGSSVLRSFFDGLTKSIGDALRQVDVQTHLINDLLDVSRITAGTLQLDVAPCDLVPLLRETIEDLRVTAPERSLLLEVPEHEAVMVLADRARLNQVVTNYVTNAIRYSPIQEPICIGLTVQDTAARVWVRDQGPGLSEEAQTHLWQRFSQVKGTPTQSGSGKSLGLGLYICRTLIALHQGEVGVESAPGEGSTFWFTLPLAKHVPLP